MSPEISLVTYRRSPRSGTAGAAVSPGAGGAGSREHDVAQGWPSSSRNGSRRNMIGSLTVRMIVQFAVVAALTMVPRRLPRSRSCSRGPSPAPCSTRTAGRSPTWPSRCARRAGQSRHDGRGRRQRPVSVRQRGPRHLRAQRRSAAAPGARRRRARGGRAAGDGGPAPVGGPRRTDHGARRGAGGDENRSHAGGRSGPAGARPPPQPRTAGRDRHGARVVDRRQRPAARARRRRRVPLRHRRCAGLRAARRAVRRGARSRDDRLGQRRHRLHPAGVRLQVRRGDRGAVRGAAPRARGAGSMASARRDARRRVLARRAAGRWAARRR